MKWTSEMEDYLRPLMKTSWTRKEIAEMLGKKFSVKVTKDAVTGKIIRMMENDK